MNAAAVRCPVGFVGLGPIGRSALAHALLHPALEIRGACDIDARLIGQPLSALVAEAPANMFIAGSIDEFLRTSDARSVILCTQSRIAAILPTVEALIRGRRHVVSSCEELIFPLGQHAQAGARIDALARQHGVAVLATGVNPGFVLDLLPTVLTGVCLNVRSIRAQRVVDTRTRRGQLQLKVGAGMTAAEFRAKAGAGQLGHVGLPESTALICRALGWGEPKMEASLEPVLAREMIETAFVRVAPGAVLGQDQKLTARTPFGSIEMRLQMYLGAPDPRDEIDIDAEPPLHCKLDGGVAGDVATVATLLNAAAGIDRLSPGLKTVLDCPPFGSRCA